MEIVNFRLKSSVYCDSRFGWLDTIVGDYNYILATLMRSVFSANRSTSPHYFFKSTRLSIALSGSLECLVRVFGTIVRIKELCASPG